MDSLNVLHISNDFANSTLYKQLVLHLDAIGIRQTIYSAVRTEKEAEYNPSELSEFNIKINNILHFYDRAFFRLKIRKIFKNLVKGIEVSKVDIIHSHTLYSDGAVALRLKDQFEIPYIVTVRNSDLNSFSKLRPDLKWRRDRILYEAKKVIFLSPAYREKLLSTVSSKTGESIRHKFATVPNGIDPLFLNYVAEDLEKKSNTLKLLYVGRFLGLKNIPNLIKVVGKLSEKIDATLTLVGGGEEEEKLKKMIKFKPYVNYLGIIKDREKLRNVYQSHDIFVMVSKPETFGLVYIEALSQGLPIVHTQGEGIDGFFGDGMVAESISNPQNIDEIASKIKILANRLDEGLKKQCREAAQKFDWGKIAQQYKSIYLQ